MIASWMLYTVLISILITLAGVAAERALMARGWQTRFVWAATIALSLAWPIGSRVARLLPDRTPVRVLPFTIVVQAPISITADEAAALARARLLDRTLMSVWIAMSILFLARLAAGVARVERSRSTWKRGHVDGMHVRLSNNVGPAVVGLRSMDVVLPEWILSLDAPLRALVLRHEDEHRRAGDPYLLFGAAFAVALMPWNAALWFQARRLRLAIEMDCDARVLRAHPTPERYGMLILTIAQRRSAAPALFAPMLSEPATNLERRILAMRSTRSRRLARATAYSGSIIAIALLAFASSLQSASPSLSKQAVMSKVSNVVSRVAGVPSVEPETIPVPRRTEVPVKGNEVRRLEGVKVTGLRAQSNGFTAPSYPALLAAANLEGAVLARFTTGAEGQVDPGSVLILKSTNPGFSDAVRAALRSSSGQPNVTMQMSYVFVMSNQTGTNLAELKSGLAEGTMLVLGTPPKTGRVAAIAEVPTPVSANETFFDFQVEQEASSAPGNQAPRYPDMLRSANVEGEVLAQFIVNADGTPDMDSFKVLKSTHDLFTNSVKSALPSMKFVPAEVGGRPVRQLIQMPFQFSLTKDP